MIKWPWMIPRAREMAIDQQPHKRQTSTPLSASLALFFIIRWRIPVVQGMIIGLQILHRRVCNSTQVLSSWYYSQTMT